MATVKEIYDKLGRLMEAHPQVSDFEVAACGASSYLNIFYDNGPDNAPTGISIEDYDFMSEHIEKVEEAVTSSGNKTLTESEKDFLVTSAMTEVATEQELLNMITKVNEKKPLGKEYI